MASTQAGGAGDDWCVCGRRVGRDKTRNALASQPGTCVAVAPPPWHGPRGAHARTRHTLIACACVCVYVQSSKIGCICRFGEATPWSGRPGACAWPRTAVGAAAPCPPLSLVSTTTPLSCPTRARTRSLSLARSRMCTPLPPPTPPHTHTHKKVRHGRPPGHHPPGPDPRPGRRRPGAPLGAAHPSPRRGPRPDLLRLAPARRPRAGRH